MNRKTKIYFTALPYWYDPEIVFETLFANETYSFWLDSSMSNNENRFSYMGKPDEIYTYSLKNSKIKIQTKEKTQHISQDIFTFLDIKLNQQKNTNDTLPFDFAGGFVGYFGYELKALTGGTNAHTSPYPDSLWYLINNFIAFDHQNKKMYFVILTNKEKAAKEWFETTNNVIARIRHLTETKQTPSKNLRLLRNDENLKINFARNKRHYLKDIQTCKEYLERGESYQICLTNTISATAQINPFLLYKLLRANNPAPYAAYIKYDDFAILSSSPEQFLQINRDRTIRTKPIKGTIKRGQSPEEDQKLKTMLSESKKDWSENAMIVDLLRNDLGKVCTFGSVKVTKSMAIESYPTVHQLVSTVTGKHRQDTSLIDCIKACFPGGSMTGAPKKRTMEIIDELENQARGIYSGALGYLSFNQTAQLNIVIRTIVVYKNQLTIGAGGAILTDSSPYDEFNEMLLKTKALVETIGQGVYTTPMHTVYIALGSNLGDKKKNIEKAIALLEKHLNDLKIAKLYKTKPMYYEDQDTFINTVIKGRTLLSPVELFAFVKNAESELGRKKRFRNGPREIDIDILFYDQLVYESDELTIPHPRISERDFVLKPFADLDPEFMHPALKKSVKELLLALKKK